MKLESKNENRKGDILDIYKWRHKSKQTMCYTENHYEI